ncbi:MAG: hypothetical protein QY309_04660 [Cyclobacteriaceae bacterium]|nr:MAG: hypothetical protein QY309_04660 [Cyclobacteriaceae bacterium]
MTKRQRLLLVVKQFAERELINNVQQWDYIQVQAYTHKIEALKNRIPKPVAQPPRISSQRKLFY